LIGKAGRGTHEHFDAIGFFFPVVPAGAARIRVQLSAAHDKEMIDRAVAAFKKVGEKYGILGLDKKGIIAKYGM
jgi:glycine C-acetyltransferase